MPRTGRHHLRRAETPRAGGRAFAGGRARPAADQAARAELRHRRQHRAPDRPRVGGRHRRRRARGRTRPGLADPGAAGGRPPGRRRRDRPGAGRGAARPPSRRTPRPRRRGSRWSQADAHAGHRAPGPPPTALVANLPYNVSVPVLLHLLALLPSLEHGLVMVQAEVADRLAAAAGLQGLRRPVGQGRVVRRRPPRRVDRPQRVLAGPQRRLRAGRLDPAGAAGHDRDPRAGVRRRRRGVRAAPQDAARRRCAGWPAPPRPPRPRWRMPASTRWPAARCSASQSSPGSPRGCASMTEPTVPGVAVRAPAKINLHLGVGPVRADGYHPLATVYQAIGLYDDVTVTATPAEDWSVTCTGGGRRRRLRACRSTTTNLGPARGAGCWPATAASTSRSRCTSQGHPGRRRPGRRLRRRRRGPGGAATGAVGPLAAADADLLALAARARQRRAVRACSAAPRPATGAASWSSRWPTPAAGGWVVLTFPTGMSTPAVYAEFDALHADVAVPEPEIPPALVAALRDADVHGARRGARQRPPAGRAADAAPSSPSPCRRGWTPPRCAALVSGSGPTCLFLCTDGDHAARVAAALAPYGRALVVPRPGRRRHRGHHPCEGVLMANLVNLERVSKSYGVRPLLDEVSLGVSVGERIGIVGRNGDGKTTLLEVMTGLEEPDAGRVSRTRGLRIGYLHQGDELVDTHTVREAVLGRQGRPRVGRRPGHPRGRRGAARRGHPRPRRRSGSPAASGAAARWPRCCSTTHDLVDPRRADQPPRRRGGRLAGRPPRRPGRPR